MKKVKKIQLTIFIVLIIIYLLIINFNLIKNKNIIKTKAQNEKEIKLIIKLQGDFSRYKKKPIYTKLEIYNPYEKIKSFENLVLNNEQENIFSLNFSIENLELNQNYSIFIKPEKYFGKVFKNFNFSENKKTFDMSNEYIYAGDIVPDGKITAYEMSMIINNLGKKDNTKTDINFDEITNTQDYFVSLYSLKENITDQKIELLPKPTPTSTPTNTPTPTITPTIAVTQSQNLTSTPANIPTTNPDITTTPSNTPTPTSTLTPTPTQISTPTSIQTQNQPTATIINQNQQLLSRLNQTKSMEYCEFMEEELPQAEMHHPEGTTQIPKTTNKICSQDKNHYYSLPYRNPNCNVTQNTIEKVYEKMKIFYPSYYKNSKIKENWKVVQEFAKKYNFNPIFVIALWIEESAAGGATNAQELGCIYRLNKDGSFTKLTAESSICEQMECLFGRKSVKPDNFGLWACQYEHGYKNWKNNDCLKPTHFTKTLEFWYDFMIKQESSIRNDCMIEKYIGANNC